MATKLHNITFSSIIFAELDASFILRSLHLFLYLRGESNWTSITQAQNTIARQTHPQAERAVHNVDGVIHRTKSKMLQFIMALSRPMSNGFHFKS